MTDIDALVASLIDRPEDRARKNALLDWCEDNGYEVRIEWRTDANLEVRYWVPGSGEFVATNVIYFNNGGKVVFGPHRLWGEGGDDGACVKTWDRFVGMMLQTPNHLALDEAATYPVTQVP